VVRVKARWRFSRDMETGVPVTYSFRKLGA